MPDADFEVYIKSASDLGQEITQVGLPQIARTLERRRPARRPRKSKPKSADSRQAIDVPPEPVTVIDELQDHRGQLESLLGDFCNGDGAVELERVKRRLARVS